MTPVDPQTLNPLSACTPHKQQRAKRSYGCAAALMALYALSGGLLLMGDVQSAFAQALPALQLSINADFIKMLPDNVHAIAISGSEKRYSIINVAAPEKKEGRLNHPVSDITLGSRSFIYLVGVKEDKAGGAIVSRLDWEVGSIVSVEIPVFFGVPSIAVDKEGTVFVGNRRGLGVTIIPGEEFGPPDVAPDASLGDRGIVIRDRVIVGRKGVGDLGVTADGAYVVVVLADGSEMLLLDRRTLTATSKYRPVPEGTSDLFVSARSMEVVAGSPLSSHSTTATVLYGFSGGIGFAKDYFVVVDLNDRYRALDVVQAVKVNFPRDFWEGEPSSAVETGPAMMIASDDDQQNILLGNDRSTRLLWFQRRGQTVVPLGDAVELEEPPIDLDVSGDGRVAVVLHKDKSTVTVLRGLRLARPSIPEILEERNCELLYAQVYLANQGYAVGAADGLEGPQTRDALRAFQLNSQLKPTGALDSATSATLLDEEFRLARESSEQTTPDMPSWERAYRLARLGSALTDLWERNRDGKYLDERVRAYRSALEELSRSPSEPIVEAVYENNLCFALAEAGYDKKDSTFLEEAIAMCRSALEKFSANELPTLWAATQHSLGFGLWRRYEQTEDETILAESAGAIQNALNIFQQSDPDCSLERVQNDLRSVEALLLRSTIR